MYLRCESIPLDSNTDRYQEEQKEETSGELRKGMMTKLKLNFEQANEKE